MQIFLPRTIRHLSLKALLFLPPLHFCLPRPRNGRSPGTCHPLSHRCQPHHPPHRASRCWCETDPDFRPPKTSFLLSACQKYSFYIYVNKWFSKVLYLWEIFFLRMLLLRACMGCCANEAFLLRFVMAHTTNVSTPLQKMKSSIESSFKQNLQWMKS